MTLRRIMFLHILTDHVQRDVQHIPVLSTQRRTQATVKLLYY